SVTNITFLFALAMGVFALSQFFGMVLLPATALLVIAGIVGFWEQLNDRTIPFIARALVTLFVGVVLAVTVIFLYLSITNIDTTVATPDAFRHPIRAIALIIIALVTIGALLIDTPNSRKRDVRSVAMLCMAIALASVAGFVWDQRTP